MAKARCEVGDECVVVVDHEPDLRDVFGLLGLKFVPDVNDGVAVPHVVGFGDVVLVVVAESGFADLPSFRVESEFRPSVALGVRAGEILPLGVFRDGGDEIIGWLGGGLFAAGQLHGFPLVKYANAVGWDIISDTAALALRRDEGGSFFYDVLRERLLRLNPGIVSEDNVAGIIQRMEAAPPTIEGNREMLEWLRGNRTVFVEADNRHRNVRVVDFDRLDENAWHVTYEWSYKPGSRKGNRMDVVFLINGVPVAMVENKNPKNPKAMERALVQLQRYEMETPEMLVAPQVFNITHLIEYFYGVTWSYARKFIFNWKDESKLAPAVASTPMLTNHVPRAARPPRRLPPPCRATRDAA